MIVVSDTSPICYLVLLDVIDILPKIYGRIVIPEWVRVELAAAKAPDAVRTWIADPPDWLEVQGAIAQSSEALQDLDRGEQEAIALAESIGADLIVLDDLAGRRAAQARGLDVVGLLGVLQTAAKRGLIDLSDVVEQLWQTNFRVSERLLRQLLEE